MYNKLFTQILDSTIWLAPDPHRLVWITLIAAMGEDCVARFACPQNLADRARVSLKHTEAALKAFQEPDPHGAEYQDYEGKRIERVPGGWHLLNGEKYRNMVTRSLMREANTERMRQWRAKNAKNKANGNSVITNNHSHVTVTAADVLAVADEVEKEEEKKPMSSQGSTGPVETVFDHWRSTWNHPQAKLDDKRKRTISAALKLYTPEQLCSAISGYRESQHHTGQNDRKTVYDDLCLLLRDAGHIDAGIAFATNKPETAHERFRRLNTQPQGAVFDAVPHSPALGKVS